MSGVADNLAAVRQRIEAACRRAGRPGDSVTLVAVSKVHPAAAVRAALGCGQRDFGENRVQELVRKAAELTAVPGPGAVAPRWHMIGSLQTNKVHDLLAIDGLVLLHSLDRPKLADVLQHELAASGRTLPVLLQIAATAEATKHGCAPEQALALLQHVRANCPALQPEGLMAMGPLEGDPTPVFRRVEALCRDLRQNTGLPMPTVSLGMSGDLEAAIACGSTMVRVGTDVFGARR